MGMSVASFFGDKHAVFTSCHTSFAVNGEPSSNRLKLMIWRNIVSLLFSLFTTKIMLLRKHFD